MIQRKQKLQPTRQDKVCKMSVRAKDVITARCSEEVNITKLMQLSPCSLTAISKNTSNIDLSIILYLNYLQTSLSKLCAFNAANHCKIFAFHYTVLGVT